MDKNEVALKYLILLLFMKQHKDLNSSCGAASLIFQRHSNKFPAGDIYFSLLHSIETGSGANPASYPVCTGDYFSGESGQGVKLIAHLHLVPRTTMVELYLHFP
jgi:hypothetical protein